MLDHLEISTLRHEECVRFYSDVLDPLGYALGVEGARSGFRHEGRLDFWVCEGQPSVDVHFAFQAPSRSAVLVAFERAGNNGGTRDREPALAPHIHANYYAGYARDPDGRLVEFVCQLPG